MLVHFEQVLSDLKGFRTILAKELFRLKINFVIISQLRCFLTFAGQSFNILIVLRASGLKATSSEALGKATRTATT